MFVHKHQLEFLLPAEWYYSPEHHALEMERLFLPSWHLVGLKSELPRPGDFRTLELLGQPVIVRNFDGEHRAFLNVCSHRHCLITSKAWGHSETLKCQYHGWEYKASGFTAKIPDATCFRPFDRENARLKVFRLESCGDLMFVSLAEQGQSLREFLGHFYDILAERATPPKWRPIWSWESDYDCNWKIGVENTVESYHLPSIHKGLFAAVYPSEKGQEHELDEKYSLLRYDLTENKILTKVQARGARIMRAPSTSVYTHVLIHPHFVFTLNDLLMHAHVYLPTSPTRSKAIVRMYGFRGERRHPRAWISSRLTAWQGRRGNRNVQLEDASIFSAVQRGLESSAYRGVIGTREERVYVFQKFVRDRCQAQPGDSRSRPEPKTPRARTVAEASSVRRARRSSPR